MSEKKALETYVDKVTWLRTHYEHLTKENDNKFFAIDGGHVVDSDSNPDKLIGRLRDVYDQERITTFAIEYVAKKPMESLL